MPYPDTSVGPPLDYDRPPGDYTPGFFQQIIGNLLGGAARDITGTPVQVMQLLDPRHPANLINWLGLLPGTRIKSGMQMSGHPNQEQWNLIRSIFRTSHTGLQPWLPGFREPGVSPRGSAKQQKLTTTPGSLFNSTYDVYDLENPLVQALAEALGRPADLPFGVQQSRYPEGHLAAGSPLYHVLQDPSMRVFRSDYPESFWSPPENLGTTPADIQNMLSPHAAELTKQAIADAMLRARETPNPRYLPPPEEPLAPVR